VWHDEAVGVSELPAWAHWDQGIMILRGVPRVNFSKSPALPDDAAA
jgi:hypothetical protein